MTTEERLSKLEDALTVEAQLLDRHERLEEERHARIDAQFEALGRTVGGLAGTMKGLIGIVEGLAAKIDLLSDRQLMTQAALDRLTEQIDRFVRGQSGNGDHKQK